jgi:hypothetical protein
MPEPSPRPLRRTADTLQPVQTEFHLQSVKHGFATDRSKIPIRAEHRLRGEAERGPSLTYGRPWSQLCEVIENAPYACPNIGFEGEFETRLLPNGLYSLGVRLADNNNSTALLFRSSHIAGSTSISKSKGAACGSRARKQSGCRCWVPITV